MIELFSTPIAYAFFGVQTEIANWLIQMGAQNPIYNAIVIGTNHENSFTITEETGRTLEFIKTPFFRNPRDLCNKLTSL